MVPAGRRSGGCESSSEIQSGTVEDGDLNTKITGVIEERSTRIGYIKQARERERKPVVVVVYGFEEGLQLLCVHLLLAEADQIRACQENAGWTQYTATAGDEEKPRQTQKESEGATNSGYQLLCCSFSTSFRGQPIPLSHSRARQPQPSM